MILLRRRLPCEGYDGGGGAQEGDEDTGRIEPPLMCGAEHGREDLLGSRALRAPVPAADFAHHDGGANRVLGPPVRRVDGGVAEDREQGRRFDGQMGDEALDRRKGGSRGADQVERLVEQPAARDGEPVCGHCASGIAIAQREGLLEAVLSLPNVAPAGPFAITFGA